MSRPQPQPDRDSIIAAIDQHIARRKKPTYTKPVETSADKLAVIHRHYYENSAGDHVSPYSLPISLC